MRFEWACAGLLLVAWGCAVHGQDARIGVCPGGDSAVHGQDDRLCTCPTRNSAADVKRFLTTNRIEGGDPALPGRYPYMVSLQKFPRIHFCGGILVKKNVVLTAAHCVHPDTRNSELFPSVSIGGVDVKGDADTETQQVCQTIIHQNYEGSSKGFDLALLVLPTDSEKTPIKLASGDPEIGKALRVLGWGRMRNGKSPPILQEGVLDVLSNPDCEIKINEEVPTTPIKIIDSMVCARRDGVDACKGDSGGPLIQVPDGNNAEHTCGKEDILVGITSRGIPCINVLYGVRFPGIYTRINDFASWIDNNGGADAKRHLNFGAEECKGLNGERQTSRPAEQQSASTVPKPPIKCRYIAGRWIPKGCRRRQ